MTCDDPLDPLFEDERFDGTEGLFSSLVLFGSPIEPLAKSQAIHLSSSIAFCNVQIVHSHILAGTATCVVLDCFVAGTLTFDSISNSILVSFASTTTADFVVVVVVVVVLLRVDKALFEAVFCKL